MFQNRTRTFRKQNPDEQTDAEASDGPEGSDEEAEQEVQLLPLKRLSAVSDTFL